MNKPTSGDRVAIASERAVAAWTHAMRAPIPSAPVTSLVVLGDPQAPLAMLFAHLDHQHLLTDDGWLRPDIGLICVGDYFDFAAEDAEDAGYQGVYFLAWLAAHDPAHVTILMGNHDAERVMSLSDCSLEHYREAQSACRAMLQHQGPRVRRAFLDAWVAKHPQHPPMVAAHDYRSYVPAQSDLVRRLLLQGRMQLAATARDDSGNTVLITHAGVTLRELSLLNASVSALDCSARLNRFLSDAVERVRPAWETHGKQPLDLAPLYVGWEHVRPNGGSLIHRPDARRGTLTHDQQLGLDAPLAPRSVPPEEFLIPGLHQVVGHTVASQRLVKWLAPRVTAAAASAGTGPILSLFFRVDESVLGLLSERRDDPSSVVFVDVALAITTPDAAAHLRLAC